MQYINYSKFRMLLMLPTFFILLPSPPPPPPPPPPTTFCGDPCQNYKLPPYINTPSFFFLMLLPPLLQPAIGVQASSEALLYCLTGPAGPYFKSGTFNPVSLYADPMFIRAWPGVSAIQRWAGENLAVKILHGKWPKYVER